MDKKNILLLIIGGGLYSIGFISFNFIGKIEFIIGGILLSILYIRLGTKISKKNRFIGKSLRLFGIFTSVIIIIISIALIISEFKF